MTDKLPPLEKFTFQDKLGRTWDVTLNLGAARRVDASDFTEITDKEFSILQPDKEFFNDVLTNTGLLFAIIWAVVQPQVKDVTGIDPATEFDRAEIDFLEALDGDAIKRGRDAVWEAIANFFPEQATVLLALKNQFTKANARIAMEVAAMEPELQKMMDREITKGMEDIKTELTQAETEPVPS